MKFQNLALTCVLLLPASTFAATVVGQNLNIGTGNSTPGNHTAAIGYNNVSSQPNSLVVGVHNYVYDGDNENSSFAAGAYNTLLGTYSIMAGAYNLANNYCTTTFGSYNYNYAPNSIVGGRGHILQATRHESALVAGVSSAIPAKPAHLVIGNGTSSSFRANSFIVYADGDIVITKPQGDISMGIYGD